MVERCNSALHVDRQIWQEVKARAAGKRLKLYEVVDEALADWLKK